MKKNIIQRNDDFSRAVYQGFVLKRSFWYGDIDGKPIAFCEKATADGYLKVYIKEESGIWTAYLMKRETVEHRYPNFKKTA